jgi:hypothetical protein
MKRLATNLFAPCAVLLLGCFTGAGCASKPAQAATPDAYVDDDALVKADTKIPIASDAGGVGGDKLLIIWTSGDKDVALKMVFMYTLAAKQNKWWDSVRFLIWGPSSKLLSQDSQLQGELAKMKSAGVELLACKACADSYGVSAKLQSLGVDVKFMGSPLTGMLKSGEWKVMTF